LVCVDRVTEPIGTRGRNPANVVDATRGVALGESFGVATVALETFEVAVGSVLVRLLEIRGDSSMNERCVDLLERPERMPETVHQHLTPLGADKLLANVSGKQTTDSSVNPCADQSGPLTDARYHPTDRERASERAAPRTHNGARTLLDRHSQRLRVPAQGGW
jgi:hypothetical protein